MKRETLSFAVALMICVSFCPAQEQKFIRTEADRHFGVSQVKQVQLDRGLGSVMALHPKVVQWMEDCFSGVYIGERVYWLDKPPVMSKLGEYEPGNENYPTVIRISNQPNITDYDRFAVLVFELHNSKRIREAWNVFNRAVAGEFGASDYATKCLEIEHAVLLECKQFLIENAFPREGNNCVRGNLDVEDDFKVYLSKKLDSEVFKAYVRFYEESITRHQKGIR